jgi:hypothetical protein
MSYQHIPNLYKAQEILLFRECYAMEKIHGTSAHIAWKDSVITFSSGGERHDRFASLFDVDMLAKHFSDLGHSSVVVFGEAYGGKCQGMSATYGKELRFVVFEVRIGDAWLSVPQAEEVTIKLGLEFVHYRKITTDLSAIDAERDEPSEQAKRNGIQEPCIREGVVLRPLIELTKNSGERIVCKHKRQEFAERKTIPNIDPAKREIMEKADDIAVEWVTDMRLTHVLDKLGNPREMKDIPRVIDAMVEDVTREASGEIADNKIVRKAIGARACKLYKTLLRSTSVMGAFEKQEQAQ